MSEVILSSQLLYDQSMMAGHHHILVCHWHDDVWFTVKHRGKSLSASLNADLSLGGVEGCVLPGQNRHLAHTNADKADFANIKEASPGSQFL